MIGARILAAAGIALVSANAVADETMKGMDGSPATAGYMKAMQDMHHGMMGMKTTGDADKDFVMMMIPHHQGAIDMAKVELRYGKDAKIKALAQEIITAQEKEIATMKAWLAKH